MAKMWRSEGTEMERHSHEGKVRKQVDENGMRVRGGAVAVRSAGRQMHQRVCSLAAYLVLCIFACTLPPFCHMEIAWLLSSLHLASP